MVRGPLPDSRWTHFSGGVTESGLALPMSFERLNEAADGWAKVLPSDLAEGPASLLKTARSLFVHAWFDYSFMVVACLVAFQALESAFRSRYPDEERPRLSTLIKRARTEGLLPKNIAELADTGRELRNLLSHPAQQAGFTPGMAGSMLENTHRLVALVGGSSVRTS